jgi:hypothetical protein
VVWFWLIENVVVQCYASIVFCTGWKSEIMKRYFCTFCLWLSFTVTVAFADPTISVGTQYMLNTNVERRIPIMVSSATHEAVEGVNLYLQVGDGGAPNGGTNTAPQITNLDLIGPGTIFNASNTGGSWMGLGVGPDNSQPPYLLAFDSTTTASGSVEANGVLAYLTVNPAGAALGAYRIDLQNAGQNIPGGPLPASDFAGIPASFLSNDGWIRIVNLHDMRWIADRNGNWTEAVWDSSAPPFPNYTANAVIDAPYTVTISGNQEANSLALSNNGKALVGSGSALTLTTSLDVGDGTTSLQVEGLLNAQAVTLNGTLIITNGGTATVTNIIGNGTIQVGGESGNSELTAGSIHADTLSIGSLGSSAAVPEPSALVLLGSALVFAIFSMRKRTYLSFYL